MTVGTKMQQTIASCESTLANLHTFALETQNPQAKQLFQNLGHQQQQILDNLKTRMQFIENEEPQYRQQKTSKLETKDSTLRFSIANSFYRRQLLNLS